MVEMLAVRLQLLKVHLQIQGSEISKLLKLRKHIVIQGSRLQGCSVYLFFFLFSVGGSWFSFRRTLSQDFSKADKAARWSLQSFCVACV